MADEITRVQEHVSEIDEKILEIDQQIEELKRQKERLEERRQEQLDMLYLIKQASEDGNSVSLETYYAETEFSWSKTLSDTAKDVFRVKTWKFNQLQAMNAVLDGRDVFVIMPTGGGKSLCYQLVATISTGIVFVVSPLLSLIQDQIYELDKIGIKAVGLTSANPASQNKEIIKYLKQFAIGQIYESEGENAEGSSGGNNVGYKMVYLTPERLSKSKELTGVLKELYKNNKITAFVIDECHCCSEFGHDFRPDYKRLGLLKMLFPKIPIMALTATCTIPVLNSVIEILSLAKPTTLLENENTKDDIRGTLVLKNPIWRSNLRYQVLLKPNSLAKQVEKIISWILENHPNEKGIIYCRTIKETEDIYRAINGSQVHGKAITVGYYHSEIPEVSKRNTHKRWKLGDIKVIIATIAFGMGIHEPGVRFVIHSYASKSPEAYYQESGRAGRDGNPATCVLFYKPTDASKLTTMGVGSGISEVVVKSWRMVEYCEQVANCRKLWFENYFGTLNSVGSGSTMSEKMCNICDICELRYETHKNSPISRSMLSRDITTEAATVINLVYVLGSNANSSPTFIQLVDVWLGSSAHKNFTPHVKPLTDSCAFVEIPVNKKKFSRLECERIVNCLILRRYIVETYHATGYNIIPRLSVNKKKSAPYLHDQTSDDFPNITMYMITDS